MARITKAEARLFNQFFNDEKRDEFLGLGRGESIRSGTGRRYTKEQMGYAFDLVSESGIRATSRILGVPRRTLQRWCRKFSVPVKRCPSWVYEWAARRRRRRDFWRRRGYF